MIGFKETKGKELSKTFGAIQVAKMYDERMVYARTTEKVKDSFVDSAMTIHKRVFSLPVASPWLEWCDDVLTDRSPWKSIYMLQAIVDRAQTSERISWAVWSLTDCFRMV